MNQIEQQVKQITETRRLGIMSHVVIGYPSLQETELIVNAMEGAGVDFVELQIPFSDPIADGPVIMKACEDALAQGVTVKDCLVLMKRLSSRSKIPLLFMAYYNTLYRYGVEKFIKDSKQAGCAGLIIPDIPLDEEHHEHFIALCKRYNLVHIRLLSPASTPARIKKNSAIAEGFIYLVSRLGTTGAQQTLAPHLARYIKNIKQFTNLPVAVGFGISKKEHIRSLKGVADIAVIGSAIIEIIRADKTGLPAQKIGRFLESLQ